MLTMVVLFCLADARDVIWDALVFTLVSFCDILCFSSNF